MPNLSGIVMIINSSLESGQFASRRFQPAKYYGIADVVKITGEESERWEPQMIDDMGEGISLVFDDNNAMMVYHRYENVSYDTPEDAYGKPGTTIRETANMRMLFVANRMRIQSDVLNCAAAIALDFPTQLIQSQTAPLGMNFCVIERDSVEPNPYTVWDQEFTGSEFGLSNNTIFLSVKYRLISEYNKDCFQICN